MILHEDLSKITSPYGDIKQETDTDELYTMTSRTAKEHCWDINDTSLPRVSK